MKVAVVFFVCIAGLMFVQACSDSGNQQTPSASAVAEHAEIVKKDLFAIISLQGSSCEQVVSYDVQDELDYVATCQTGERYRVHVSSEGRVHVNTHGDTE